MNYLKNESNVTSIQQPITVSKSASVNHPAILITNPKKRMSLISNLFIFIYRKEYKHDNPNEEYPIS